MTVSNSMPNCHLSDNLPSVQPRRAIIAKAAIRPSSRIAKRVSPSTGSVAWIATPTMPAGIHETTARTPKAAQRRPSANRESATPSNQSRAMRLSMSETVVEITMCDTQPSAHRRNRKSDKSGLSTQRNRGNRNMETSPRALDATFSMTFWRKERSPEATAYRPLGRTGNPEAIRRLRTSGTAATSATNCIHGCESVDVNTANCSSSLPRQATAATMNSAPNAVTSSVERGCRIMTNATNTPGATGGIQFPAAKDTVAPTTAAIATKQ